MKKAGLVIMGLLLISLIAIIVRYSVLGVPDEIEEETVVEVRLKWLHQSQFAGMYWADKKGLYKDEGLNVVLKPFDYEHLPVDEVVSGNAKFGVTGADELLIARSEGKPVKALAVIYQKNPVVAYALQSSGIENPKDFIGKKIGIQMGVNVEYQIRAMLAAQGIGYDTDIDAVEIGYDAESLINEEVDVATGYITNEPIQAEKAGYPVNTILPADYGVNVYADVLFATEETIEKDIELTSSFVEATLIGWEEALGNIDEAVDITLMYKDPNNDALNFEHQKKLLENSVLLIKPNEGTSIGEMSFIKWQQSYDLLKKYNIITKEIDINESYTRNFLR